MRMRAIKNNTVILIDFHRFNIQSFRITLLYVFNLYKCINSMTCKSHIVSHDDDTDTNQLHILLVHIS